MKNKECSHEGEIMKKSVLIWELVGIIFIFSLGSILHFAFDWSGRWKPLALIAAVNESVWEHLKLGFWPALLYSVFEYKYLKKSTNNFLIAKTIALYLIPITITVLFYSYTAILGYDLLVIDILVFAVAIIIGQLASYKVLTSPQLPQGLNKIALIALAFLLLVFSLFTFYPPHLPIFKDPVSGGYGIPK